MSNMFASNHTTIYCAQPTSRLHPEPTRLTIANGVNMPGLLLGLLSFSNLGWVLLLFFIAGNIKCMPFIWHLRLVNAFRFTLRSQRSKEIEVGPDHLFLPMITESKAPLMEIDLNLHKTNSSYFSDIDISRTHLICTLFSKGIEEMRGGCGAYTLSKAPVFGIALGAVSCSFRKELKPYEAYEMWTRLLSWDDKWIYVVTHFVRKGTARPEVYTLYPGQQTPASVNPKSRKFDPKSDIVASALSKCVFKSGRRTISPEVMLQASGLLPESDITQDGVSSPRSEKEVLKSLSDYQALSDSDLQDRIEKSSASGWSYDRIEEERRKGMQVGRSLATEAQELLEKNFLHEEALGRHRDGTGFTGLFSCFAQLGHLKKEQLL